MYYHAIVQCILAIETIEVFLDKAERSANEQRIDVDALMRASLAPDMKPLIYQVQSACDYLKAGAAWLSGQTPPKHADDEQTIGDVRARIRKTIEFARSVGEDQYTNANEQKVTMTWAPGKVLAGQSYLLQMTIPNVYFHVAMTYAILRKAGVDVGKMDFLGAVDFQDA
jgi:uncharacterized protein